MAHAERCPICNGNGTIKTTQDDGTTLGSVELQETCHGCDGKGWVTVSDGQGYYGDHYNDPPIYDPFPRWPYPWRISGGTNEIITCEIEIPT